MNGEAEVHRVAGGRGELPGRQRPGGLAALTAPLAGVVVAPEVGAAVRVRDVEQRHPLQRLPVRHVQGHSVTLRTHAATISNRRHHW